jgi:hypothetical protein
MSIWTSITGFVTRAIDTVRILTGYNALSEETAITNKTLKIVFKENDESVKIFTPEKIEDTTLFFGDYVRETAGLVAANNVIVGFRPISKHTLDGIKSGKFIGKSMDIKGKSSPFGQNLSGKVPVNQKFSKLLDEDPSSIEDFSKKNEESLEKSNNKFGSVGKIILKDANNREVFGVTDSNGNPVIRDNHEPIFVSKKEN